MLQNISVINFLIYSVGIGFIAAIIFTNIQRGALSAFINALIENGCFSEESSKNLSELGIKGLYASIASSAVKTQYGLRKSILTFIPATESKDKLEAFLDSNNETKFYISSECDTELLLKRYNYKPLSAKMLVLLIAALIIVVILATKLADLLIENVVVSKSEVQNTNETTSEEETVPDTFAEFDIFDEFDEFDVENDSFSDSNEEISSEDEIYTPRVPVS